MKPHKWAKEIKAWADGAEIEYRRGEHDTWEQCGSPRWHTGHGGEYRIKLKTRKAIIDGVEYVIPEALPDGIKTKNSFFYCDVAGNIVEDDGTTMFSRSFATIEDAELFAKAEKALRGIL